MLHNIKCLYLHRVFHGIRFKVNNGNWLSVKIAFFCALYSHEKSREKFCSICSINISVGMDKATAAFL